MAATRLTQEYLEGLTPGVPSLRGTQVYVEALTAITTLTNVRLTQEYVEAVTPGTPQVRGTQVYIEALTSVAVVPALRRRLVGAQVIG